ncbi:hypothetical protein [Rhodobacter capsulatus]|uniref:hypothetical protein n=1 Tax=Rhodobacter capsulatus TaxID=1061 RepID=UPI004028F7F0
MTGKQDKFSAFPALRGGQGHGIGETIAAEMVQHRGSHRTGKACSRRNPGKIAADSPFPEAHPLGITEGPGFGRWPWGRPVTIEIFGCSGRLMWCCRRRGDLRSRDDREAGKTKTAVLAGCFVHPDPARLSKGVASQMWWANPP